MHVFIGALRRAFENIPLCPAVFFCLLVEYISPQDRFFLSICMSKYLTGSNLIKVDENTVIIQSTLFVMEEY